MKQPPQTIRFDLTIEEANLIFSALGKLPFNQVYELIGKLNAQANAQYPLPSANTKGTAAGSFAPSAQTQTQGKAP